MRCAMLLGISALRYGSPATRWKRVGWHFRPECFDTTLVGGAMRASSAHASTTSSPRRNVSSARMATGSEMFRIWNGGLGIWGGVLCGALGAWAWCRHKHYPMALLADAIAPGAAWSRRLFGRLGQLVQPGAVRQAPTTLPWGLKLNMERQCHRASARPCYDGASMPERHAVPSDVPVRDDLEPHRRRADRLDRFHRLDEQAQGRFPVRACT